MAQAGIVLQWGATHRHNGVLIVTMVSVAPPGPIECVRFSCLWNYLIKSLRYVLITLYHKHRVIYAETHRDEEIPLHYRTGTPSPETGWGALKEILRLKIRR